MKRILVFLLFLYLIYLFIFNKQIVYSLSLVSDIYFKSYLVSLFPFILFTNLLLKANVIITIHKYLIRHNKLFLFDIFIIILMILIGIPGNINLMNYLHSSNLINKKEKDVYINCFGGISFPFVYLVLLNQSQNKYLIISILIIVELFMFFFSHCKKEEKTDYKYIPIEINVIKQTGWSLFVILFSLLAFSSLTSLVNNRNLICIFFKGLIEFSYNCLQLSKYNTLLSTLLLTFIISFSSLSLIVQIKSIDASFKVLPYLKKRAIIALFVSLITYLFL